MFYSCARAPSNGGAPTHVTGKTLLTSELYPDHTGTCAPWLSCSAIRPNVGYSGQAGFEDGVGHSTKVVRDSGIYIILIYINIY